MPTCKLSYFNVRGLAEPIRCLLAYAKIEYEDIRLDWEEWNATIKAQMPFGKVPVLEIDGRKLYQTIAILRYLGKKHGLMPSRDEDQLQCDMLVDTLTDLRTQSSQNYLEKDEERKKEGRETLINETIPYYFSRFDEIIKKNDGYVVKGVLTWADFYIAGILDLMEAIYGKDVLEKYESLKALMNRVNNLPGVKEWIEKRPVTEL